MKKIELFSTIMQHMGLVPANGCKYGSRGFYHVYANIFVSFVMAKRIANHIMWSRTTSGSKGYTAINYGGKYELYFDEFGGVLVTFYGGKCKFYVNKTDVSIIRNQRSHNFDVTRVGFRKWKNRGTRGFMDTCGGYLFKDES